MKGHPLSFRCHSRSLQQVIQSFNQRIERVMKITLLRICEKTKRPIVPKQLHLRNAPLMKKFYLPALAARPT